VRGHDSEESGAEWKTVHSIRQCLSAVMLSKLIATSTKKISKLDAVQRPGLELPIRRGALCVWTVWCPLAALSLP